MIRHTLTVVDVRFRWVIRDDQVVGETISGGPGKLQYRVTTALDRQVTVHAWQNVPTVTQSFVDAEDNQ